MDRITSYRVVRHGLCNPSSENYSDYDNYHDVAVGDGESEYRAFTAAIDMMCMSHNISPLSVARLETLALEMDMTIVLADDCYYYVSIYYNLEDDGLE
jgi:hypothetical protein